MTNIPDGYGFVAGRSRANAKAILAAAEAAGVDVNLVRTVSGGYLAPEAAVKAFEGENFDASDEETDDGKSGLSEGTPDESWKNADIKKWAEDHEVDLGDATKKADMLDAISTADTKEE